MILNNFYIITSCFVIISGFSSFVMYRKHLLSSLLSLEFIMLGIFFFMSSFISIVGSEMYFILFFLTLAACEGALGLSLLVCIVCFYGNDYFNSFSSLGC
uniref:NADH-ubiquinone oxidoreductase chain 4L n=1 Tax=Grimothea gregaria TaxID=306053 RepID=A0A342KBL3_9EUCA|nr:NADH dehydrogenase subunit 4L [Grimothea gregaria]AND82243.1 NADH dehydrogenase subunit 4L [Grimothea gregaria]